MEKTNISDFNKFIKKEEKKTNPYRGVVVYSRVSSLRQLEDNHSIDFQVSEITNYCKDQGYEIIKTFGQKNECAKRDFNRKEFKSMMEFIRKSKRKPLGIVVYDVNRFSRTGGSAIGIVEDLQSCGVHLFEVSSELNTMTDKGLFKIQQKLLDSKKENMDRIDTVKPRIVSHMKGGKWFGTVPVGYDHYGPRVKDEKKKKKQQKIVINNDGRILKEGFMMKLTEQVSDVEIAKHLKTRGLVICRKKLGTIWKNPFYCGINRNKMLDEVVEGNWEKLVSKKDFRRLQIVLENNHAGYKHSKKEEYRPLSHFLRCNDCGNHLSGYRSKGYPYYKCNYCKVNLNGNTSSKNIGADDLFRNLLRDHEINPKFIQLIEIQLNKVMGYYTAMECNREKEILSQLKELQDKLETMELKLVTGEIPRELFDKYQPKIQSEIIKKTVELNAIHPTLSNQEETIRKVCGNLGNIANIWDLCVVEDKQKLQETLFPGGIYFDKKNHCYLTRNINNFMLLSSSLSMSYGDKKNEDKPTNYDLSSSVAGARLELTTFGL